MGECNACKIKEAISEIIAKQSLINDVAFQAGLNEEKVKRLLESIRENVNSELFPDIDYDVTPERIEMTKRVWDGIREPPLPTPRPSYYDPAPRHYSPSMREHPETAGEFMYSNPADNR